MGLKNYDIAAPQTIRFGVDALNTLSDEANKMRVKKALIITGPVVYKSGLFDLTNQQLSKAKLSVEVFHDSEPEPTLSKLNAAAKELRKSKFDLLIGLGGGSSLDTAKGLSVLLTHGGDGQDYLGVNKVPGPCIPVIAIPTTAGTGSEATNIAIFGDSEKQLKIGMVSPYLLPRLAIVDPTLTYTCPQSVSAASGIDALVHAIESYTSTKANNFTDALALKSMQLISNSLNTAVKNGSDKEARSQMAEGALLAGIAFGNAGVAAVHALAYALGSRFHVPHGVANGLLLPHVMECNLTADPQKYAIIAHILGLPIERQSAQESAERGVLAAKALVKDIGITARLRDLGVPKTALEPMAKATMDVTRLLANNPKKLTLDDVMHIWENAW